MLMHDVDEKNFENLISKGTVIIDFYATWCGPCKMLAPELESLNNKNKDIIVCKIDVDNHTELARSYGVMTIPTLVLYKDGTLVKKSSGYMPLEALEEWIK